ncbi:hypothetical protein SAMN04487819_1059 [Actinopolyspora alba]|uniref:ABC-2 family transporter protein n=2 Tax=Actinopolyspora alba TaxID=673379 RepID=A0A1I1W5E2_9ACTN|nr:hypothetical protein SAMN04487819_1059 [Actinopolyspora alba]
MHAVLVMMMRLLWCELWRLLLRYRFAVAVLLAGVVGAVVMVGMNPVAGSRGSLYEIHVFGALSESFLGVYAFLVPLMAGVAAAGSLAEDRARDYPQWILIRGVGAGRFLGVKAVAMFLTTVTAFLMSQLIVFCTATVVFPWGTTAPPVGAEHLLGNHLAPELFVAAPAMHDLMLVAMLSVAAGVLSLTGLVVGALIANEYLAAAVPFLLVVGSALVLEGPARRLSPYTYLELDTSPGPGSTGAVLLYWGVLAVLTVAVATGLFVRREAQ